jgi:hypothetical protein
MSKDKRKLTIHVPLSKCVDSMLSDSDQEVATYELTDADGGGEVSIQVLGAVLVKFDDEYYESASQMPEELLEIIREGELWNDERVEVTENNWFEAILVREGADGGQSFVLDGWDSADDLRSVLDWCVKDCGWVKGDTK